jgi:2'-5' RNA ligase
MDAEASVDAARLFWAVPLEPGPRLRDVLTELQRWRAVLRLTNPDQWHLTLKFLGDTPPERFPDLFAAAARLTCPPATAVTCRGLGVFPPRGRPTVLWAGLDDAPGLVRLAEELDAAMVLLGYAPERRRFHPHLTLARLKAPLPRPMQHWYERHQAADWGTLLLRELVLYRSQLTPQGSLYTRVWQRPFD